jgi:NADH dehydrogenase
LSADFDVVTGAYSYTGRYIAARLLEAGRSVRTLTNHPSRPDPFGGRVPAGPYRFADPVALARTLEGADVLYNTYWVRFDHGQVRLADAVEHSRALFQAARHAGVRRIVHVSITNPSVSSPFPYFRGKALVEQALAECGLPFAIVRPTVVFGNEDVLINNIAWLLRRFPIFAVAGDGQYRLRPVHVDDVAAICVNAGSAAGDLVVDAVGPEVFTFVEMVGAITAAIGKSPYIVHVPPVVILALSRVLSLVVRDVLLTGDELRGMMAELVTTDGPATGQTVLTEWLMQRGEQLGRRYASELDRHFARVGA